MDLYVVQAKPASTPFATTMPSDEFAAKAYPTGQWINVSALQRRLEATERAVDGLTERLDTPNWRQRR